MRITDSGIKGQTTYLLYSLFVSLFETEDLVGSLLGVIDLLPRLDLLLLEQCNTIGQQKGISLNATSMVRLVSPCGYKQIVVDTYSLRRFLVSASEVCWAKRRASS